MAYKVIKGKNNIRGEQIFVDVVSGSVISASYFVGNGSLLTNLTVASASYAQTASFAISSSFAVNSTTASYYDTSSLLITASVSNATITFVKGNNSTFPLTINNVVNAETASYVLNVVSASYASNSDLLDNRDSTTFAGTGSNIFNGNQIITGTLNVSSALSGTTAQFTIITGSTGLFTSVTASFTGSAAGLYNLTASGISNFTNDVRGQFSQGTNITIVGGVISSTGGGSGAPGGTNTSVQFNSGSVFSGSTQLVYNYNTNTLSGTTAEFTTITGSIVTGSTGLFTSITASTATIGTALYTSKTTTTVVGNNAIYNIATASYDGLFVDYTVRSGSNARAGQIMAIWSGSSVNYTETTTNDFGSTTGLAMAVVINGTNMQLSASASSINWTVKTILRTI